MTDIDPKIIEAAARAVWSSGAMTTLETVAIAIPAALTAGLREQIRAEALREAAAVANAHRARIPGHHPDGPRDDLVAQGYGNASLNIAAAILALLDKPAPDGGQL
jgi:hypothetical protein